MKVTTFGTVDARSKTQLDTCLAAAEQREGQELWGVLCADHHPGYSQPIGGVVAYEHHVSPSGVGYDIACGNMAAKTDIRYEDAKSMVPRFMTEIWRRISFGVGRSNTERVESPVIDAIAKSPVKEQRSLVHMAANQLGTVGA
ncbi:MAG: RtcB family protein, partial [Gemmatimonadales bacterium]